MSHDDLHNPRTPGEANGDGGAADAVDALLDRVTSAVRDMPVPDGPDEQTLGSTLAALRAAQAPRPSVPIPISRKLTMKPFMKFAIAACVALVAGIVFLVAEPFSRQGLAFAKVLEQVQQARSVRFNATVTVTLADGREHTANTTMAILGNRMRQELPETVTVMDFEKGEVLSLMTKTKEGWRMTMQNMPDQVKSMNLIEQFRNMKADQAKDLGEKEIEGRKLHGFIVEQPGNSLTVWADPGTREPVRIEATINIASIPASTSVFKDFKWDAPVDPSEVSLDVPAGYEIRSMTMDASMPTEKDLIEGVRTLAALNGDEFPVSLDMAGMAAALTKYHEKTPAKTPEERKEAQAKMMAQAMKIARALACITPAVGEDWHYAGNGVKLNEVDRPILWYKPQGSEKYRVLYADLSAKEVLPDALPKIEAKKLTAGPSPFVPPAAPGK